MKKLLLLVAALCLLATFVVACGGSTPTTNANAGNTVHMDEMSFLTKNITIKKGESITLVDDVAIPHTIQNGTWESNGTPKPVKEAGAPDVQVQFNGGDTHTVGPFNNAGVFQLYCTIHQGMNLTVTVQ